MRLTQFSDYALRTLLYLRVHEDRAVPLAEIARSDPEQDVRYAAELVLSRRRAPAPAD